MWQVRGGVPYSAEEDGATLVAYARRDLAPGEALTLNYAPRGFDAQWDVVRRRAFLFETRHFWCRCVRCEVEAAAAGEYVAADEAAVRAAAKAKAKANKGGAFAVYDLDEAAEAAAGRSAAMQEALEELSVASGSAGSPNGAQRAQDGEYAVIARAAGSSRASRMRKWLPLALALGATGGVAAAAAYLPPEVVAQVRARAAEKLAEALQLRARVGEKVVEAWAGVLQRVNERVPQVRAKAAEVTAKVAEVTAKATAKVTEATTKVLQRVRARGIQS